MQRYPFLKGIYLQAFFHTYTCYHSENRTDVKIKKKRTKFIPINQSKQTVAEKCNFYFKLSVDLLLYIVSYMSSPLDRSLLVQVSSLSSCDVDIVTGIIYMLCNAGSFKFSIAMICYGYFESQMEVCFWYIFLQ